MMIKGIKKSLVKIAAAVLTAAGLACVICSVPIHADTKDDKGAGTAHLCVSSEYADSICEMKKTKNKAVYQVVTRKGYKCWLQAVSTEGKVEWSVDRPDVIKILAKNNQECEAMPQKDGKATITAKARNVTIKYKVTVKTGKKFLKAWCKQWVKDNISKDMEMEEKLMLASAYVVSNRNSYGSTSEPEDVLTTGVGNCVSGGKLVAEMCKAMGYDAKIRFAAKDDMSRYPGGVIFMEQHYNVEVTVDGRKYYIDGTPGGMICYLSTKKETLFYCYVVNDKFYGPDEFMDIPAKELLGMQI